jgi:hypothetical protein
MHGAKGASPNLSDPFPSCHLRRRSQSTLLVWEDLSFQEAGIVEDDGELERADGFPTDRKGRDSWGRDVQLHIASPAETDCVNPSLLN